MSTNIAEFEALRMKFARAYSAIHSNFVGANITRWNNLILPNFIKRAAAMGYSKYELMIGIVPSDEIEKTEVITPPDSPIFTTDTKKNLIIGGLAIAGGLVALAIFAGGKKK